MRLEDTGMKLQTYHILYMLTRLGHHVDDKADATAD
jgi:hypothetical protein